MALEFLTLLAQIPDPRRGQGQKWKLPPVLLATILAILSGATSYRKVHRFIEAHRLHLNEAFEFGWKTAPAYSAIRFILQGLDSDMVERVFRQHGAQLNSSGRSKNVNEMAVVAIDGKTLRGSFDAFNDQKVFIDAQRGKHIGDLRHIADANANALLGWNPQEILAI